MFIRSFSAMIRVALAVAVVSSLPTLFLCKILQMIMFILFNTMFVFIF